MELEPNYHVSVWDEPVPTYLCLICDLRGLTLAAVTAHLAEAHASAAIPTPAIPHLLRFRDEADTSAAASPSPIQPPREELPHG
jgi:hypothetical protein